MMAPLVVRCPVCEEDQDQPLYSIADCPHRFCRQCCLAYIDTRAEAFSQAQCLEQGCRAPLSPGRPIYGMVSARTKAALERYQEYSKLQGNTRVKGCRVADCPGSFDFEQRRCSTCRREHCPRCWQVAHEGQCSQEADLQMQQLNYRRCPHCHIWVEKTAGCEYISCKCGTHFCYRCGAEFSVDPCRLGRVWSGQWRLRAILLRLTWPMNRAKDLGWWLRLAGLVCLLPISVCWLLVAATALAALSLMLVLCLPLALFQMTSSIEGSGRRWGLRVCLLAFWPCLGAVALLAVMVGVLLYPCLRHNYHHGAYDPIDNGLLWMAIAYSSLLRCLVGQEE